jgi:hypothetical protein
MGRKSSVRKKNRALGGGTKTSDERFPVGVPRRTYILKGRPGQGHGNLAHLFHMMVFQERHNLLQALAGHSHNLDLELSFGQVVLRGTILVEPNRVPYEVGELAGTDGEVKGLVVQAHERDGAGTGRRHGGGRGNPSKSFTQGGREGKQASKQSFGNCGAK